MSSSSAPSRASRRASRTLVSVVWPPEGKPTGPPTRVAPPRGTRERSSGTKCGRACAAMKPWRVAISASARMSASPWKACTALMSIICASAALVSSLPSADWSFMSPPDPSAGAQARYFNHQNCATARRIRPALRGGSPFLRSITTHAPDARSHAPPRASRCRGGRSRSGQSIAGDRRIGARLRLRHGRAARGDVEHAAAVGDEPPSVARRAGMKDLDAGRRLGGVDAVDRAALLRSRRDNPWPPSPRSAPPRRASAGRTARARRRRWRAAAAADRTSAASSAPGFPGSPKRTLYSISFGPSAVIISPANSTPVNGAPVSAMPRMVGSTISPMVRCAITSASSPAPANRRPCRRCWDRCRRRRRACGPAPCRGQRSRRRRKREEARLLALEKLLDHDLRAGRAEGAVEAVARSRRRPHRRSRRR